MQSDFLVIVDVVIPLVVIFGASILVMTLTHILLSVRNHRLTTEICCVLGLGVYLFLDIAFGTFAIYRILILLSLITPLMIVEAVRSSDVSSTTVQLIETEGGGVSKDALCFSWNKGHIAFAAIEVTGVPFLDQETDRSRDSESDLKSLHPLWMIGQKTDTVYTIEITLDRGLARYYIFLISHHEDWSRALGNVRKARRTVTKWLDWWDYETETLDSKHLWRHYRNLNLDDSQEHYPALEKLDKSSLEAMTITDTPSDSSKNLSIMVNTLIESGMTGRLQLTFRSDKTPQLRYLIPEPSAQDQKRIPYKVEDHQLRDVYKQIAEIEACEETGTFRFNILVISETNADDVSTILQSIWSGTEISRMSMNHARRSWRYIQTRQYFANKSATVSGATFSTLLQMTDPIPGVSNRIIPPRFALPKHDLFDGNSIEIGSVLSGGKLTEQIYRIPVDAFCLHTGIFGSPGSGKTNTAMQIVTQLAEKGVPFLIICPAKTEWRQLLSLLPDVRVFTVGNEQVARFRYNFLIPPPNVSINTHINNIADCFIASWPSEGIITEHIIKIFRRAYDNAGWDRLTNEHGKPILISDLYAAMEQVAAELSYGQLQQDFFGAHKSRFGSLLDDVMMAVTLNTEHGLTIPELLEHRTVIEIRSMNSSQTSLITSLITVAVAEYLEAQPQRIKQELRQLLVLEEAHHVLKRATRSMSINEGHSSKQMAIDTIVNLLREARGLGLGLILIDQLPGEMADAAVKLPGITIIHQIKDPRERILVGTQVDLNEGQISYIGSLNVGEAIIHRNLDSNYNFAVNCQVSLCLDEGIMWTNEQLSKVMESYYREQPHLLIQLLPSTAQWEPDPLILRKLLLLTESPSFLKNFKMCLVFNQNAASSYVREIVETAVQQPTEVDLYATLILPHLIQSVNGNEFWENNESMGVEGCG